MGTSVRGALNRANVIGFDVSTTDHKLTAVVSRSTVVNSGFNFIFKVRAEITGGNAELFPLGHVALVPTDATNFTDLLAANANAAQADVVVTNVGRFAVGDYVFLQNNTYTNYEWGRVASIVTATSTLTLDDVLSNSYTVATGSEIGVLGNLNSRMPISVGYIVNESGLNLCSLYVRKLQAANVRVKGYAVMV